MRLKLTATNMSLLLRFEKDPGNPTIYFHVNYTDLRKNSHWQLYGCFLMTPVVFTSEAKSRSFPLIKYAC